MGNNRGSQTGGQGAKIKNYSHNNLLTETELKPAVTGSTLGQKERRLLYAQIFKLQKGVMLGVMRLLMNENLKSQSQIHVTA